MAEIKTLNIMHKRVVFDCLQMPIDTFKMRYSKHFGLDPGVLEIIWWGMREVAPAFDREISHFQYLEPEEIQKLKIEIVEVIQLDLSAEDADTEIAKSVELQTQEIVASKVMRKFKYHELKKLGLEDEKIKKALGINQSYLEYCKRATEGMD